MIATISFGSIAEWLIGAFVLGFLSGLVLCLWLSVQKK